MIGLTTEMIEKAVDEWLARGYLNEPAGVCGDSNDCVVSQALNASHLYPRSQYHASTTGSDVMILPVHDDGVTEFERVDLSHDLKQLVKAFDSRGKRGLSKWDVLEMWQQIKGETA